MQSDEKTNANNHKLLDDTTTADNARKSLLSQSNATITVEHSKDPTEIANNNNNKTLQLGEVNVLYGQTSSLVYDPVQERYVNTRTLSPFSRNLQSTNNNNTTQQQQQQHHSHNPLSHFIHQTLIPRLTVAFLPVGGVTNNYYRFTQWRILQRWVSANLNVIGTQSLLLGLGISTTRSQLGALSAALQWVLKDALGKVVRMFWASRMGQRFDSDAKRWRFRSSLIYAAGNALELVTALHPHLFLLYATAANCCKQVSMLTSSSTRTAVYNSFRDGTRENIGDITAKGEAQIAVVDLVGIATGVTLSRMAGTSVQSVAALYVVLQSVEIICMYRQLRAVCYRVLNFERLVHVMELFGRDWLREKEMMTTVDNSGAIHTTTATCIPTPSVLAAHERIFLPPRDLSRRSTAYGSLGRTKLSPSELQELLVLCAKERFLLVVGANVKHPSRHWRRGRRNTTKKHRTEQIQKNCHIVLHEDATNLDIVKSTLALTVLRQKLAEKLSVVVDNVVDANEIRSSDCMDLIAAALREANESFPQLLRQLTQQGWESPARFMFGRVHMRARWPLEGTSRMAKRRK